jgi:hypothetical protein
MCLREFAAEEINAVPCRVLLKRSDRDSVVRGSQEGSRRGGKQVVRHVVVRFHRYSNVIMVAVALIAGAVVAQRARGAEPTPLLSASGGSGPNSVSFTLGWEFTVGAQPIQVTALGLWDSGADGFAAPHAVGVWNASGSSLLGQVTVPAGTAAALNAGDRYTDLLVPVDLAASTKYVIGAAYNSDDPYRWFGGFGDFANNHVNGDITVGFGRNESGSSLTFPTGTTSAVYTGPNALFVNVPEPAGAGVLVGVAVAAAPIRSRRRRRGLDRLHRRRLQPSQCQACFRRRSSWR